ncbi:MAG: hydrogenase [Pedosphaera sp.]|nr:hydrogenase [Pedosphaera sp.]
MKTIPPSCPVPDTGPKYWRSLDQLAETPEFRQWAEREFPAGASELTDPVTRRTFVKIMSASFLLAGFGLSGCRRPVENIYPFSKMPEGYVHGVPKFFATSMPMRGSAVPLLAKSHEGRPTKLEGNPHHPDSNGSTDRYTQASILDLYDPDRAVRFAQANNTVSAEAALAHLGELSQQAQANGGEGLSFLVEQSSSPSRARLQKALGEKLPKAKWFVYEPVDFDIQRQAAALAFGKSVSPYVKLDEAKVIVALDCDFIGSEENAFINIRRFAKSRKLESSTDSMSRLYAVEGLMTLTGANADHRLRIPTSAVIQVAALLAKEILQQSGNVDSGLATAVSNLVNDKALKAIAEQNKPGDQELLKRWTPDWIHNWAVVCAKDLLANRGRSVVLAGYRQPLAVHLIANALNVALGNIGHTVVFHDAPAPKTGSIVELAQALNADQVGTLVILGGNPVYNAPAELAWEKAQTKARNVVRLGYYEDESFPANGWSLPLAHYLESWGDARTSDGTIVSVQPLIEPLFAGLTEIEVIARIAGFEKTSAYDIVRETFRDLNGGGEEAWKQFLHDGFLPNTAAKPVEVRLNAAGVTQALSAVDPVIVPDLKKLEVVFHRDYKMDDGRFNNNGWMQELPDPVSKITWENVVLLSVKTAKDLGLNINNRENNRLMVPWVKVELDGRSVEGPAWIQPGQADNVVGLALGYGRKKTGRVGVNSGFDAYQLRTSKTSHCGAGATLTETGKKHLLSTTQDHWGMEGRPIIREGTLKEFQEHPNFATEMSMEKPPVFDSLYKNPLDKFKEEGKAKANHQWGMSIDLNSCVGCSSCMIACQSENNVPIVGKYQVANNREMHWLRIDRYYTGAVENPQMVTQPMLCQHCESAPCENVCPVNATSHDQEGLNVMTYNRCVGTRYCSNNCPYKVRRFNFFDYNRRPLAQLEGPVYTTPLLHSTEGEWDMLRWWRDPDRGTKPTDEWELLKLVKNPDVTVRMRGVMEKCTFCLQRIEGAKIAQKVKAGASADVIVPDGTIKTACQQACPAEAIEFGNIADPTSKVSKLKASQRNYSVLEFLNTKPRTTYLARVRNPNPEMPDAYLMPSSTEEFEKKNKDGNPYDLEGGHLPEHSKPAGAGEKKGAA